MERKGKSFHADRQKTEKARSPLTDLLLLISLTLLLHNDDEVVIALLLELGHLDTGIL